MKGKIFISMFVIFLIMGYASHGFSMGRRPASKKSGSPKATSASSKITGIVLNYNMQNSTLTVATEAIPSLTFKIDEGTLISKGKKLIKLTDMKPGDFVEVNYLEPKGAKGARKVALYINYINIPEKSGPVPRKTEKSR